LEPNKIDMNLFHMKYYFIQKNQDSSIGTVTR